MSQEQIDAMADAANKRIRDFVARMAGQQVRRMRESWRRQS